MFTNSRQLLLSDDETVVEEYESTVTRLSELLTKPGIKPYLFDFLIVIIAIRVGTGTEL